MIIILLKHFRIGVMVLKEQERLARCLRYKSKTMKHQNIPFFFTRNSKKSR